MSSTSYEIYWDDLTDEAKRSLIEEGFDAHENIDMSPLAIIEIEDDLDDEEPLTGEDNFDDDFSFIGTDWENK
jgi:hypothetical protein